jgi:O-acetylserine/cysteine efflux transporter
VAGSGWSGTARLMFLFIVIVWGFNYLFVNVGLGFSSPLWLASLRAGIGALAAIGIVSARRGWGSIDGRGRRDALLLGIPNTGVFFGLWFVAARNVLPGLAAVFIYTFPLWVALLSAPVLHHTLARRHWGAVAIGFVGVALISQVWNLASGSVTVVPLLMLLAAAISWALGTVLFQKRFDRTEMLEANAFQVAGGATMLVIASVVLAPLPLPNFTPTLWATVLWLGVLGTGIAYSLWFTLLGETRAARLSAFVFLVPVVALAASAVVFGERLSVPQLVGVGLVLLAIYAIGGISETAFARETAVPSPPE